MKYTDIKSPAWADAKNTVITCLVKFTAFADYLPFAASSTDTEAHGRDIFTRCAAGEFGEVVAYVAPVRTAADYRQINAAQFVAYRNAATETLMMLECIPEPGEVQRADILSVREYLAALAVTDFGVAAPAWPVLPESVIL